MFYFLFSIFALWILPAVSLGGQPHNHLHTQSLESIESEISSLYINGQWIYLLPADHYKLWLIQTPYSEEGKTREKVFGKLTDSKRIAFPAEIKLANMLTRFQKQTILIDSRNMFIYALDSEHQFLSSGSIAWDTLLPPQDHNGEATQYEIDKLRKKFKASFRASPRDRIIGIQQLQPDNDKPNYLLSTRIAGYPFLEMECDPANITRCQITRACYTDFNGNQENWHGLGFIPPNNFLVFDTEQQSVLRFQKNSCFDFQFKDEHPFPKGYKPIKTISTDEKGKLWFSSTERDPYINANVYFWPNFETFKQSSQQ